MYEVLTRQEKLRSTLTGLDDIIVGRSTQLRMFPGELKRFKKEFPNLTFEVMKTSKTPKSKMHVVNITCKK